MIKCYRCGIETYGATNTTGECPYCDTMFKNKDKNMQDISACIDYGNIENICPLSKLCLRANLKGMTKYQSYSNFNMHRKGNECEFFHPRVARRLDNSSE